RLVRILLMLRELLAARFGRFFRLFRTRFAQNSRVVSTLGFGPPPSAGFPNDLCTDVATMEMRHGCQPILINVHEGSSHRVRLLVRMVSDARLFDKRPVVIVGHGA